MDFYSRMRTTANKALKSKGQSITLTAQVVGAYDPATGAAAVTTSSQIAYGVVFEYGNENIDGNLIKSGDKRLILSALTTSGTVLVDPALNDLVSLVATSLLTDESGNSLTDESGNRLIAENSGISYTITQIKPLSPAGTVVMYDCNLRGI